MYLLLVQVEVNEKSMRNIFIVNSGKFNFDYSWHLNERSAKQARMVSISPGAGAVGYGGRTKCQLAFCPPGRASLRGCELVLKVTKLSEGTTSTN